MSPKQGNSNNGPQKDPKKKPEQASASPSLDAPAGMEEFSSALRTLTRVLPTMSDEQLLEIGRALAPLYPKIAQLTANAQREAQDSDIKALLKYLKDPMHRIPIGDAAPEIVTSYIEITPFDLQKFEVSKVSGNMRLDRPQIGSNICPEPYGFIPQTHCGTLVGEFAGKKAGRKNIIGDGDALDICVISTDPLHRGGVEIPARVIGGFRLLDGGTADDKILAIGKDDPWSSKIKGVQDVPEAVLKRLKHYFLTYKDMPGETRKRTCEITHTYGIKEAYEVIRCAQADYDAKFSQVVKMRERYLD